MRQYIFKVVITEQNDEEKERLDKANLTGCDEMIGALDDALYSANLGKVEEILLINYSNSKGV